MRARTFGIIGVAVVMAAGCGSDSGDGGRADLNPPEVPPPIPAGQVQGYAGGRAIPDGVLTIEAKAALPPPDPDVRWIRSDGADLPTHLSPCRMPLAGDADRVAARQVVLTPTKEALAGGRPALWKSVRLTVYRDPAAARGAVAELRSALTSCAEHDEGGGVTTRWRFEPLAIGEEALFVGGQMYRGATALRGHYRGVVMRQGRAVMTYVDFGPLTEPATPEETSEMQKDARVMAERLTGAQWLR